MALVKSFVTALSRAGRVVTKRTERGALRVELQGPAVANPSQAVSANRRRVRSA